MLLSTWRPKLKTSLLANTSIDTWDIVMPEGDQMVGFLPPLESLIYRETDDGVVEGTAQQSVYIRKRYANDVRYESLPIASLEGFHASISLRLVRQFQSINLELLRLDMERVDQPLIVEEGGNGDFIVTMQFRFEIAWTVETEPQYPLKPPFELKKIVAGIWRQRGDEFEESDRVLDQQVRKTFSLALILRGFARPPVFYYINRGRSCNLAKRKPPGIS